MTEKHKQGEKGEQAVVDPRDYDWENCYQTGEQLPWDTGEHAPELEQFLTAPPEGFVSTGAALEVGCGTGTNATWLAGRGMKVTATEIAPTALEAARNRGVKAGVEVNWRLVDVCQEAPVADASQDFAFDRGVFHVMSPERRPAFAASLGRALKSGAYWLCLAGSKDEHRENPEVGPPQLSAMDLIADVEPLFMVYSLQRSRFLIPGGHSFLAWRAVFRRR